MAPRPLFVWACHRTGLARNQAAWHSAGRELLTADGEDWSEPQDAQGLCAAQGAAQYSKTSSKGSPCQRAPVPRHGLLWPGNRLHGAVGSSTCQWPMVEQTSETWTPVTRRVCQQVSSCLLVLPTCCDKVAEQRRGPAACGERNGNDPTRWEDDWVDYCVMADFDTAAAPSLQLWALRRRQFVITRLEFGRPFVFTVQGGVLTTFGTD